jgi:hypothetical protein
LGFSPKISNKLPKNFHESGDTLVEIPLDPMIFEKVYNLQGKVCHKADEIFIIWPKNGNFPDSESA